MSLEEIFRFFFRAHRFLGLNENSFENTGENWDVETGVSVVVTRRSGRDSEAVNDIAVGSKPADGGHHKNISRPGFSGFPIVSSLYRDHNSFNFCSFKSTIHLITCPFLLFSWNLYFNNVSFLGCILHFAVFFFLQNLSRLSKEVIFCCFAKIWQLFRRLKMSRKKIL